MITQFIAQAVCDIVFSWYGDQTVEEGFLQQVVEFLCWQTMHTIHLLAYKYDGDGLKACEVLSEILFMLSQAGKGFSPEGLIGMRLGCNLNLCPELEFSAEEVIQTSLLILIALGYTLLQSKIGELDLM